MPTRKTTVADDARSILNCVRKLVRALRLFDKEAQSRYGLTTAQLFVLHVIRDNPQCSMNELASLTATDQSTASVIVQRLVDGGYVSRKSSTHDRRTVVLNLTKEGETLTRNSPVPVQERILQSASTMSPADRAALIRLLRSFLGGMEAGDTEAAMLFEDAAPRRRPKA